HFLSLSAFTPIYDANFAADIWAFSLNLFISFPDAIKINLDYFQLIFGQCPNCTYLCFYNYGNKYSYKMNYKKEFPVLSAKLKGIAPKTITEDQMMAALELGCHHETIRRYLRGEVAKKKFALDLISFM